MNKNLLSRTKALVEALEDDTDLAADVTNAALGDEGGAGDPGAEGALPPPPADELGGELPPEAGFEGGPEGGLEGGLEGGAPEDEALGLLRDIAGGIDRLANELAPAPEGEGLPGEEGGEGDPPFGGEEGGEGPAGAAKDDEDEDKDDEPGVPPVEDDDDFAETMPVASGS